jgi:short-subunit dehydrogenase
MSKPFAIVTGASSGIGLELAVICAQEGFDLLVAADRPEIHAAAEQLRSLGAAVTVVYLVQLVSRTMRSRGQGRILLTGSIAGFMPGTYQAVYNGTKAFIDSFCFALRAELRDTGVTVTCLMPGATETDFFERADMLDTKVGQSKKDDPADVARLGFDAMMRGDGDVVSGWKNKLQSAIATVTPAGVLAEQHRRLAEPGSARKANE